MKNNKFCTYSPLLFKTCTNTMLNFLLRRCLDGRKHRNLFDFFPESELGCGPHDPIGKFTNIFHFKRDKRKARKFKKNNNKQTNKHLTARDVFVALAVQARMIKCGKVIIIIIIIIIMMVY